MAANRLTEITDLEVSVGDDDTHAGVKLGVDGEPFWRIHITPQGTIYTGDGFTYPLTPFTGGGGTVDVLSNVAQDRLVGRLTAGSGDSEELTAAQVKTFLAIAQSDVSGLVAALAGKVASTTFPVTETIALSDETTAITVGTAKVTWRAPWAFTLTSVRASLNTASSSGIPTVDINEAGVTILSTKLTIDANEKTSTTASAAAVISDSAIADDAELTFDIDVAGTGAKGLKVTLIGTRSL